MKFLACSHCLGEDADRRGDRRPVQEITNPLVVTKRPVPKVLPKKQTASASKKRFPAFLQALTSWPRRRRRSQPKPHGSPGTIKKTVRVIEPPSGKRRVVRYRPPSRTQRLIRLYEERAQSPTGGRYPEDYLIDPPASFSGDDSLESHQNFKNKLNTLDFKRMNTVALEEPTSLPSTSTRTSVYGKNSYEESHSLPIGKCARKTVLEDFLKERLRIEQTMIDLLNGRDPGSKILRKSRLEDAKKVRFSDDKQEARCCDDGQEARGCADKREVRIDVAGEKIINLKEDGSVEQETEIKLSVDPETKVEDFYVERRTTFLKDKTVEDKALVLKIGAKDDHDLEDTIGMRRARDQVFRNFGKMNL